MARTKPAMTCAPPFPCGRLHQSLSLTRLASALASTTIRAHGRLRCAGVRPRIGPDRGGHTSAKRYAEAEVMVDRMLAQTPRHAAALQLKALLAHCAATDRAAHAAAVAASRCGPDTRRPCANRIAKRPIALRAPHERGPGERRMRRYPRLSSGARTRSGRTPTLVRASASRLQDTETMQRRPTLLRESSS